MSSRSDETPRATRRTGPSLAVRPRPRRRVARARTSARPVFRHWQQGHRPSRYRW
jgi:hypothetical protein